MVRTGTLLLGILLARAPFAFADDAPKRVLLVTYSGGFIHDSVATAEHVLEALGPREGYTLTCYRFTGAPDARVKVKRKVDGKDVETETTALEDYSARCRETTGEPVTREQCGRINAQTLKNFDAVIFFTTGNPVTPDELKDLIAWVKAGGAFVGTHCATDTLYGTPYGELVGAYFDGHPWHQRILLHVDDPKHPAAGVFAEGAGVVDEIYQFKDNPYSRDRLHIILSVDNQSIDVKKGKRSDKDYAVAWCQPVGKGRSFYTSLGHRKEVWKDFRFQLHLLGGLKWAMGLLEGNATPSGPAKRAG
jgi:type 1 glutamine amidotransferase